MREFRLDNRLTQEKLAEALHLTARSYQKLERGVHQPSATTLALFLGQLTDQEILAFVHTFGKLAEAGHSEEVA
ncbi:MAG TPA: helix-turn-helix domain-containing protein [Candidatus Acutalibacter stercorigallinarum]|nr:helix-turn-helix domain-containing protein [Candidatus Acutalibacter stercorigallinarum]